MCKACLKIKLLKINEELNLFKIAIQILHSELINNIIIINININLNIKMKMNEIGCVKTNLQIFNNKISKENNEQGKK